MKYLRIVDWRFFFFALHGIILRSAIKHKNHMGKKRNHDDLNNVTWWLEWYSWQE